MTRSKWSTIVDKILQSSVAAFALVTACSVPAIAADAVWKTVQYHPYEQVSVDCGAVLLCEIQLQSGERVQGGAASLVPLWDYNLVYEGGANGTPHLIVKPVRAGLHENVIITTNRHMYRLFLNSTASESPTYMRFVYDDEQHAREHHVAQLRRIASEHRPRAVHTYAPEIRTIAQACASMKQPGWRMDRTPAQFKPRQVCESMDHTFIAMPLTNTQPTDLPIPLAMTADGDLPVNYRYDAGARVFIIDGASPEYVLVVGSRRKTIRMRIQRIEPSRRRR